MVEVLLLLDGCSHAEALEEKSVAEETVEVDAEEEEWMRLLLEEEEDVVKVFVKKGGCCCTDGVDGVG